jgi:hypothetical protein
MSRVKKSFVNPFSFREYASNPSQMFDYTMTNLMDNYYDQALDQTTNGMFKAVCLSGMRTDDNTGTGNDETDAEKAGRYITVVVRPLTPFGKILPDPREYDNGIDINNVIKFHAASFLARSDFEFEDQSPIQFGQIVNCYFENGSISNSNFTGLRFTEPKGTLLDTSFAKLASIEGVSSVSEAFDNGRPAPLGDEMPEMSGQVDPLALRYDNENMGYKARNTAFINQAHPEFQNYIKAFIVLCKDAGITIYLNSTHRTRAGQDALIAEYNAGDRKIKPAKYSYHLAGLAFDFNPIMPDGTWIKSTMSKQIWINSGVPNIGESVGLRWGGNFSDNYDPVHFDLGNFVSKEVMTSMIDAANKKGAEATSISTGTKLPNSYGSTQLYEDTDPSYDPYGESDVPESDPYATSESDPYGTSEQV